MPIGDTRIVRRFAALPTRLSDGSWRWLAWYVETQHFDSDESGWSTGTWEPIERWV